MATVVARLYEVRCHFTWQDENDVGVWHCATLDGAKRFIAKQKDVDWYAIEGQDFIPCNENDPGGQLYIGMIYHEFKEIK